MRVRFTLPAYADLAEILDYIGRWSPQGAIRVNQRIRTLIELLLEHPHLGRPTDDPTIRRMPTSPYPYLVFYEVTGDEVIIHAVRHGARDPASMPGEGPSRSEP
ncbi:MAG: type II toxin-antitoxin system RelE/ParE family toxin [Pseudomonadota bacterium]